MSSDGDEEEMDSHETLKLSNVDDIARIQWMETEVLVEASVDFHGLSRGNAPGDPKNEENEDTEEELRGWDGRNVVWDWIWVWIWAIVDSWSINGECCHIIAFALVIVTMFGSFASVSCEILRAFIEVNASHLS